MKLLGIDFGSKKIGIALTDDAGMMAFPYAVVPSDKKFIGYIEDLVAEKQVGEIVIGHSLSNTGHENAIHDLVKEFITEITLAIGIPVHLEPEQYSSQEAVQIQGKNKQIDASAAAIILNSFIMRQKNKQ